MAKGKTLANKVSNSSEDKTVSIECAVAAVEVIKERLKSLAGFGFELSSQLEKLKSLNDKTDKFAILKSETFYSIEEWNDLFNE